MMRVSMRDTGLLTVFLVVAAVAGLVGFTGCAGGSSNGDGSAGNPSAAGSSGALSLTAVVSGDATRPLTFSPSQRGNPASLILAASRARDFKARVRVENQAPKLVEIATATSDSLLLSTTISDLPAGRRQVLVEVVPAGFTAGDPLLKSYVVSTVSDGQTTSTTAGVTFETTAKALVYEAWAGSPTAFIDANSFRPPASAVASLAADLAGIVTIARTLATTTEFILPPAIEATASGIAAGLPLPVTDLATRFSRDANGVITDSSTRLQWREGPDRAMNWNEGQAWIASLGGSWRTPTRSELANLYIPDTARMGGTSAADGSKAAQGPFSLHLASPFQLKNAYCVLAEERDDSTAWYVVFTDDYGSTGFWTPKPSSEWLYRVFAVR